MSEQTSTTAALYLALHHPEAAEALTLLGVRNQRILHGLIEVICDAALQAYGSPYGGGTTKNLEELETKVQTPGNVSNSPVTVTDPQMERLLKRVMRALENERAFLSLKVKGHVETVTEDVAPRGPYRRRERDE